MMITFTIRSQEGNGRVMEQRPGANAKVLSMAQLWIASPVHLGQAA